MYAANLLPRLKSGDRAGTNVSVLVLAPAGDVFIPPVSQPHPRPDITTIHVEPVSGGYWAPTHNPAAVSQHVASWGRTHDTTQSHTIPRRAP